MQKTLLGGLVALLFASTSVQAAAPDPLHGWLGGDAASFKIWTQARLDDERAAIAQLKAMQGLRTIVNTLALFDAAQNALNLASNQTYILYAVGDAADLRDAAQALQQVVSTAATQLALDRDVYDALSALAISPEGQKADPATRYYLDHTLLEYRLAGVDRDDATRAKVQALQDRITQLSLVFGRNVQDDVRKVPATMAEMTGLPQDYIAKHPAGADGSVTLTTDQPDVGPVLKFAESPALRKRMELAYANRAFPANEPVLKDLLATRQELATLLGYPRFADLATVDQMMGSTANLHAFLTQIDTASKPIADKETAQLIAFVTKTDPKALPLTDADAGYWREMYRRSAYDFNSQSVRPYFPFAQVQAGVLATAARLFHLRFVAAPDAATWDTGVSTFDVFDAQGETSGRKLGRIYLDMHPRAGKDKWFSSAPVVPGGRQLPEGVLICNFTGGTAGDPGLMEYGDVVTFFHEFGHLMHHILGGQGQWSGQGGFGVEGDFVEAPSQMLEEFFRDPTVLQGFAKQYQTGAVLPATTIAKMNRASAYGRGSWVQTQLFYATYSFEIHNEPPQPIDLQSLYEQDERHFVPWQVVPGQHEFAAFTHLVGYSSNYYTYMLDKVIAVDFFDQFDKAHLLDGPTALRYRHAVLEPGSTKPAAALVHDFLGRPQSVDALTKWMNVEFQAP